MVEILDVLDVVLDVAILVTFAWASVRILSEIRKR